VTATNGKAVLDSHGHIIFTPTADYNGTATVTLQVTDSSGETARQTFNVTVTPENDAPIVASVINEQSVNEGDNLDFTVPAGTFTDIDQGDTLTYTATMAGGAALPGWLHFDPATRTFSGTPASGDAGTVAVKVTATDGAGEHVATGFNINVVDATAPNAPTIDVIPLGNDLTPTITGSAEAGSRVALTVDGVVHQITANANGKWTFTPANALTGNDHTISATATDSSHHTSLPASSSFTTDTTAQAPTGISFESAGSDGIYNKAEVGSDGTVTATIGLPGDAKAGDTLTIGSTPHVLTAQDIKAGHVTQEVAPGTKVTASITDAVGNTSTVTSGDVAAAADTTARAADDRKDISEDDHSGISGNVLDNDEPGAHVSGTLGRIPGHYGTFVLNADGSYTYTLDHADAAKEKAIQGLAEHASLTDTIEYEMTDAHGNTAKATLTVTIQGKDDAAVVTGDLIADTISSQPEPMGVQVIWSGFLGNLWSNHAGDLIELTKADAGKWFFIKSVINSGDDRQVFKYGEVSLSRDIFDNANAQILVYTGDPNYGDHGWVVAPISAKGHTIKVPYTGSITASGEIGIYDVDADHQPVFAEVNKVPGNNGYGSFSLKNGHWYYEINDTGKAIPVGVIETDAHTFIASDGTPRHILVTVRGHSPTTADAMLDADEQNDIDLAYLHDEMAKTDHLISDAQTVLHDLEAKGGDTAAAQENLENLLDTQSDLKADIAAIEHPEPTQHPDGAESPDHTDDLISSLLTGEVHVDEFQLDLGNVVTVLEDAKAEKAVEDTADALKKVAGLLEEHPDSVEAGLVHSVENAPIKEPVPSDHAIQKAAEGTTEHADDNDQSAEHTDYVSPTHPIDDDEHHDGSGLT